MCFVTFNPCNEWMNRNELHNVHSGFWVFNFAYQHSTCSALQLVLHSNFGQLFVFNIIAWLHQQLLLLSYYEGEQSFIFVCKLGKTQRQSKLIQTVCLKYGFILMDGFSLTAWAPFVTICCCYSSENIHTTASFGILKQWSILIRLLVE